MAEKKQNGWIGILKWLAGPVILILAGAVFAHEIELARIKATRFTDRDGAELREHIADRLAEIRETLVGMKADLRAIRERVGQ